MIEKGSDSLWFEDQTLFGLVGARGLVPEDEVK